MLGTKKIDKTLSVLTGMALICAAFISSAFANGDFKADITVNGQVTVNNQPAVSNSTVVSGSLITTGTGSSAVIGLGGNGRVELGPDSSLTLRYSGDSIVAMLDAGNVRVSNAAGIGTTVTTRTATVVADTGSANNFSVDIGCGDDVKCAQTMVQTTSGLVTLKAGNTSKKVATGMNAVGGGSASGCKPCFRPSADDTETNETGIGNNALAALMIGLGGLALTAIIYGQQNDGKQSGPVIVVSPFQ